MGRVSGERGLVFAVVVVMVMMLVGGSVARPDKDAMDRFWGNLTGEVRLEKPGDTSIADLFGKVLDNEFKENDTPEPPDGNSFNSSVADHQAVLETVAIINPDKNKNDSTATNTTEGSDETTTLIDKEDNVFVMSNRKSKYPVLQVDLRFISDLVFVIVSAAIGGIIFSCLGQPVIVGYLLAGSFIGPGGVMFINEIVQVETVAQFGVVFLLFALGLEFSISKLKIVGFVAVFGGLAQIIIFMLLCGITAMLCSANLSEGIFVGSFLSMSSTAVVSKFLMEKNINSTLYGQVTIGTLILQDCAVGLLFALLPILGGSGLLQGIMSMTKFNGLMEHLTQCLNKKIEIVELQFFNLKGCLCNDLIYTDDVVIDSKDTERSMAAAKDAFGELYSHTVLQVNSEKSNIFLSLSGSCGNSLDLAQQIGFQIGSLPV